MYSPSEIFRPDGLLATQVSGYQFRPQQLEMAEAVAAAVQSGDKLIAEAGTGTGKTYAYLVPAILCGRKIIISTGTRNLQDQLFFKDVPFIREALGLPVRIALLKGRANYLCRYRLAANQTSKRFKRMQDIHEFEQIRQWAGQTELGDITELPVVPEDSSVWPLVTCTTENCIGAECELFSDCYLTQARRAAQAADIVIINHHLFFADHALKEEGFGELLPGADVVIFDEAHQLPAIAHTFFGISLSSRQLKILLKDVTESIAACSLDKEQLDSVIQAAETTLKDLQSCVARQERRVAWSDLPQRDRFLSDLEKLGNLLQVLGAMLEPVVSQDKVLERIHGRCAQLLATLKVFMSVLPENFIQWLDIHKASFSVHGTPVNIAEDFKRIVNTPKSWIFTSATLTAGESFNHFTNALGLDDTINRTWSSPFDFHRQALLHIPQDMPLPADPAYTRSVVSAALPLLYASRGRAFMLFTSYRALHEAHDILKYETDFNLLVQGSTSKLDLLRQFREQENAVLLGTTSFWEGVDVRGDTLSLVVIDKLPFAAPTDPVIRGKLEDIERRGENPFWQLQVPQAIIMLKQGVGRLIRDQQDTGVLMICDPRLMTKSYGKKFLSSLPPMPLSRDQQDAIDFFQRRESLELDVPV